jgi:hypothetical protein
MQFGLNDERLRDDDGAVLVRDDHSARENDNAAQAIGSSQLMKVRPLTDGGAAVPNTRSEARPSRLRDIAHDSLSISELLIRRASKLSAHRDIALGATPPDQQSKARND